MTETECHPVGAIAFAEARGQVTQGYQPTEPLGFGDQRVFDMTEHVVNHVKAISRTQEEVGIQRWAQGWPGGCSI